MAPELTTTSRQPAAASSSAWAASAERKASSGVPSARTSVDELDPAYKRFLYPQAYVVGMEQGLARVRDELVRERLAATPGPLLWKTTKL